MYNDLFSIGRFTVHTYGLMIAIGIIMAYVVAERRAKKQGLEYEKVFDLVLWCVIFGFLGAKILYIITIFPTVIKDPMMIITTFGDGWVIYGGIIFGILGAYLFCRRNKFSALTYFDLALPSVALAQGFGRIGCFFAGCCYGHETSSPLSITFHNSDFAPNGVALIPTQLISSGLDFINFFILITFNKKKKADGQVAALYLILYSAGRFILEFFRGDIERGSVGPLSTSQFIAIFMFAAGVILMVAATKRGYKFVPETAEAEDAVTEEDEGETAESEETVDADAESEDTDEAEETDFTETQTVKKEAKQVKETDPSTDDSDKEDLETEEDKEKDTEDFREV